MEKLELKHLSPYLPYRLNMLYDFEMGDVWTLDTTNINAITEFDKPILRPLSDLTKEMIYNEETFIPIKEICNLELYSHYELKDFVTNNFRYGNTESLSYQLLSKLLEWHFDVFGLIEKGLAIDVNTLK